MEVIFIRVVGLQAYTYSMKFHTTWWRHQMETFSALLAICAGNSLVPGEFPAQRPVTRSFDVFFDLRLNKQSSKQSWGWWFETLPRPLWRHSNEMFPIGDTPASVRVMAGTATLQAIIWTSYEWYLSRNQCCYLSLYRFKWRKSRYRRVKCIHMKSVLPHDDVIKWEQFPRYWPFVRGTHRPPVNCPHKGQWRGALMFCLICIWINSRVNNREAGDLRRCLAHYDVTEMKCSPLVIWYISIGSGNGWYRHTTSHFPNLVWLISITK